MATFQSNVENNKQQAETYGNSQRKHEKTDDSRFIKTMVIVGGAVLAAVALLIAITR